MFDKIINRVRENKLLLIILMVILILVLFLILGLYTRAYLVPKVDEAAISSVNISTCGYYTLGSESDSINLAKAYPMQDVDGMQTSGYSFSLKNTCTETTEINIYLVVTSDSTIDDSYVKYSFNSTPDMLSTLPLYNLTTSTINQFKAKTSKTITKTYLLKNVSLDSEVTYNYNLKLWLDFETPNEIQGQAFNATVVIGDSSTGASA